MTTLFAYIDAGTGSLVLQMVVGGLMAGLMAVKMFWRQLTGTVRSWLTPAAAPTSQVNASTED